jgi:uncharacterized LabA/DUF88 family protein
VRTAVYVDGFNLYYGVAKPLDCKWVDLEAYFERHFQNDDVRAIKFYEAIVLGNQGARQKSYLKALESSPKIAVKLGTMKEKRRSCRVGECTHSGARSYLDYEEKHTDVSIAIDIVDDTHLAAYDKIVVVTADTDLLPAIQLAKERRPQQKIALCVPALDKKRIFGAKELAVASDSFTRINVELFLQCQFEEKFVDSQGVTHTRPKDWRKAPLTAAREWRQANRGRWINKLPNW